MYTGGSKVTPSVQSSGHRTYEVCCFCPTGSVMFPVELTHYGLTLEVLECAIENISWSVRGIPNVEFYGKLH